MWLQNRSVNFAPISCSKFLNNILGIFILVQMNTFSYTWNLKTKKEIQSFEIFYFNPILEIGIELLTCYSIISNDY